MMEGHGGNGIGYVSMGCWKMQLVTGRGCRNREAL